MKAIKLLALVFALLLSVSLFAACGNNSTDTETKSENDQETKAETDSETKPSVDFDFSRIFDEKGFVKGVKASELVTLPAYKGIKVTSADITYDEKDLDEQISMILESNATKKEVKDRAVKDGDTLNIDYVGKMNGVAFEGGSTEGQGAEVTIGVTSYIDDFLEQLIGHNPGETFDIEVTFPDPYPNNPDFAGKDATFTVTVNYIVESIPATELTDEIAKNYNFDSKDALIDDIKQWLIDTKKEEIFAKILDEATCDENKIPADMITYMQDLEVAYYSSYATMFGMTGEDYLLAMSGKESIEVYREENKETYVKNAMQILATQAIAELENLSVTDDDIIEAAMDSYIETYGKPYIMQSVLFSEVVPNFVYDHFEVNDAE